MNTYIALLRGINVAGKKKILMAELRELLSQNKFENVQTYIQSGNVVFNHPSNQPEKLSLLIEQVISSHYGFDVPTLVLLPQEIKKAIKQNPFITHLEIEESQTYFTFLKSLPNQENIDDFNTCNYPNETFIIKEKVVYYYCSTGYGKAKLTNKVMENKLNTRATTRNYKTTLKLISMSENCF